MPPRVVRMPSAGVHAVNILRARFHAHQNHLPALRLELFGLTSELNTMTPLAAPGEAGSPEPMTSRWACGSSVGCSNWSSEDGSMRANRLAGG